MNPVSDNILMKNWEYSNKFIKGLFWSLISLITFSGVNAQQKAFFYLRDKSNSSYSVSRPEQYLSERAIQRRTRQNLSITETDLPPNRSYLDSIRGTGAKVISASRWFNAVFVEGDSSALKKISGFSFVKDQEKRFRIGESHRAHSISIPQSANLTPGMYGSAYDQLKKIGLDQMHRDGYTGKGVLIAVLDAGFLNANKISFFDSLISKKQIVSTYDFVEYKTDVYKSDPHGTKVLSCMAAYKPEVYVGGAFDASYLLLRTENNTSETMWEEVNWLLGAEYADSAGADIINSSVGYNLFDHSASNHTIKELDGKTTIITRAAQAAAATGMLVVNSAGNDGAKPWKYIFAPADGDSVLTVGAVDMQGGYAAFSSVGPTADERIKPDVVAVGASAYVISSDGIVVTDNGTSFSCPQITSLAAGLWQAHPELSAYQIKEMIINSASQYDLPDNKLGYGIPDYNRMNLRNDANQAYLKINQQSIKLPGVKTTDHIHIKINDVMGRIYGQFDAEKKSNYNIDLLIPASQQLLLLHYSTERNFGCLKILW